MRIIRGKYQRRQITAPNNLPVRPTTDMAKESLFNILENHVDFEDITEAVPAYLCFFFIFLMYSISEGIAIGVISYVIINVACGRTKKITPLMYVLAVLFVLKYIFL